MAEQDLDLDLNNKINILSSRCLEALVALTALLALISPNNPVRQVLLSPFGK